MIVRNLYLVKGIKYYGAYQGDSAEEIVKLLVPEVSPEAAHDRAEITGLIDEISEVRLLYEVIEGCGLSENGIWEAVEGFDTEQIYKV